MDETESPYKWPGLMNVVIGPLLMGFAWHGHDELVFGAGAFLTAFGIALVIAWQRRCGP